jgi:hypothetical protein
MKFNISFPESVHTGPITGRLFLIVTRNGDSEPRTQLFDVPIFATDVLQLGPDTLAVIDATTPGYPIRSLTDIPRGDYYVQAVLNVYTRFDRADGHTIWAHMDRWEGQDLGRSPGNLFSEVRNICLDPATCSEVQLELSKVIPSVIVPDDTEWVRRIKFESKLLTRFWGRSMYVGATVLLPRGYENNSDERYPIIYVQGHFSLDAPFGFKSEPDPPGYKSWAQRRKEWAAQGVNMPEPPADAEFNGALFNVESGYEFFQEWTSNNFPRVIAVTLQHPTPYFDSSYGVDSANAGPYGQAIMTELIPRIEQEFRVVAEPHARVLTGCSTGGWISLALQVYHPEFFGGAWSFCPDPVDFRRYYGGVNLYQGENAFVTDGAEWFAQERPLFRRPDGQVRITNRQFSRLASITGTQDPGYGWTGFTPVDSTGYPKPVWDLATGEIDRDVVTYMKEHNYDLCDYLERNWSKIGRHLTGKLHIYCGDDDGGYFNLAVYLLEEFLRNTTSPHFGGSFTYGRPLKGHGWQPMTTAELVRLMANHIRVHAPGGADTRWLRNG